MFRLTGALKLVRSGNVAKLLQLIEAGEQDIALKEKENENIYNIPWQEWKSHAYAWRSYVEGLILLTDCHRRGFSDDKQNEKACEKFIQSIRDHPTGSSLVAFAYLLNLVGNLERSVYYLEEAKKLDPFNKDVEILLGCTEPKLRSRTKKNSSEMVVNSNPIEYQQQRTLNFNFHINQDPLTVLSEEIVLQILSYLTVPELVLVSQVNTTWYRITNDFTLWKAKYLERFIPNEDIEKTFKWMYKEGHIISKNWRFGKCWSTPLTSHNGAVDCLQFDEQHLITGSHDRTFKIWSLETGRCINTVQASSHPIRCLAFNENFIITGSQTFVQLWDTNTLQLSHTFDSAADGNILCMKIHKSLTATGAGELVILWNIDQENSIWFGERNEMNGHNRAVTALQFLDESKIVSGSEDCTTKLWDIHTNKIVGNFSGHKMPVTSLQAEGTIVATGSIDNTIKIYDIRMRIQLETLNCNQGSVTALQFDNYHIVTGHESGAVTHWDIRNTKWYQQCFFAHNNSITCIQMDQTKFITGSKDNVVTIWDFQNKGTRPTTISYNSQQSFVNNENSSKYCNIL